MSKEIHPGDLSRTRSYPDPRDSLPPGGVSGITSRGMRVPIDHDAPAPDLDSAPPVRKRRTRAAPAASETGGSGDLSIQQMEQMLREAKARVAQAAAQPAPGPSRRSRSQGRRRGPGEDVLTPEALATGRQVDVSNTNPSGTRATRQNIVELPVRRREARKRAATWCSVDGRTYSIPTMRRVENKLKPDPDRVLICLFMSIREMRLGGDPFAVWDAFKFELRDMEGQQLYPVEHLNEPDADSAFAFMDEGSDDDDVEGRAYVEEEYGLAEDD